MYIDLFFTVLLIICASIIIKNRKNINSLFLRIKKHKVWIVIIAIVLISYSVMLIDTSSVMREVRDAFLGKIESSENIGGEINYYNFNSDYPDEKLGKADLTLIRLFTLHNFHEGYIGAYYSYAAYDEAGDLITGSWRIPTKWKIHKENGKWEITDIYEAP